MITTSLRPDRRMPRGNHVTIACRLMTTVFVMACSVITTSAARADQILETDSSCLTSYLHSSATNVHGVRPLVEQRGVNLDGSLKNGSAFAMRIAGNPFGDGVGWSGNARSNGMWLDTGTFAISDVDLSLPAPGFRWNVSRSYNAHQEDSGSSHLDSNGYQGRNWFQNSQPEILLYEGTTDDEDIVYLVYGADRFLEYRRTASTGDVFKGKNGAAGVFEYAEGATNEPDTYTLTDQHGNEIVFFGFDADASPCDGQFWKMSDPDGNTAYVGNSSTGSTAISNGYNSSGYITEAYDTAGRKFTYTYSTIDSVDRLTQVKAEVNDSGWVEVGKVDYAYYQTGDNTYGDNGTLMQVKVTTPLSDSSVSVEKKKYYRYWKGTYNASTNPGHPYGIKYIVDFEGVRNYDWTQDSSLDDDHHSASNDNLKPYASAYFEYDSSHRINEAWFNGACGCSGGANGTYSFEYETNASYTDNSGYDQTWARRTIVLRPDNAYVTQYFDEVGQPLSRVLTDADPDNTMPVPDTWVHEILRNTDGQIDEKRTPAANLTYTHATGTIAGELSTGLIMTYTRVSSGDLKGFLNSTKRQIGTTGQSYFDRDLDYDATPPSKTIGTGDTADVIRPVIEDTRVMVADNITVESSGVATQVSTTAYSGADALALKQSDTTNPTVGTAENGSNSATTSKLYRDESGVVTFTKNEDAIIGYREYTGGQLTKSIQDADTTKTGTGEDFENVTVPTGFSSTGSPFHRVTTYTYDDQGRIDTVTSPSGLVSKTYYSKLADGRMVTLRYPKYDSGTPTFYGPVSYTVTNHAGQAEATATVSLSGNTSTSAITAHIDETDSDPILAMDLGTVARLSVSVMDEPGTTVEESRAYFDIPASGDGTEGTNFDSTYFGYDDMGRRWRTKDPTGTIRRSAYDAIGRTQYTYVGTNDSSFSGGEASGTDDMVKISEIVYDSGNDAGNSLVTKTTAFVEDGTTDRRDTTYEYDSRGRRLVTKNPVAPHTVVELDNLGRVVAAAQYSGKTNISTATDPDASGIQSDRIGLTVTDYDAMGRIWKTVRHEVVQSDGSLDESLESLTWYDDAGRVIKVDGGRLTKSSYDRIGRQTRSFILAVAENSGGSVESTYADAEDVTDDIVLVESQTVYASGTDDNVLMRATIERHHDDYGGSEHPGALDDNNDGGSSDDLLITAADINGRIQITAMWYDDMDRPEDTVQYGTFGGSNFDRDGRAVPTRSDTALRTTTTYNDDGSVKEITDPRGLVTRYEYDDAGRQTAVIANYVNGVPSSSTGDDDVLTRYAYTDGLQTKIWVDVDGDNVEDADDQVTTYDYGTTKGATAGDSEIGTGHLLQKVTYPDSSSGTDVVTYAYNAQSQQIWMKDQAGNIVETDFDDGGREEHRRASTTASGFDTAVLRITTAYTSRGHVETVTQYDNATVGSGSVVDQVKYTHDDWGNVTKFEQDRNSAITGGETDGSYGYYDVDYTWDDVTTGRNTLQKSTMDLPDGTTVTYEYLSTNDLHDSDASRVTRVKVGATVVAAYAYNGAGSVVGEDYPEPDIMWNRYGTTSGSYPDLDRFNRVTSSRWTTDLTPTDVDFYDIDITYDRNSNITLIEDNVHTGFDVSYTNDNLNRLTQAEEGTWNSGTSQIDSRTRNQVWTLDQVGNWDIGKLDLDGDNNYNETNEYNDDRTHNVVNELTARDVDDDSSDDYTLTYDAVGNLTDDGENYEYEYDVFGRLRKIKDESDQSLVAEYKYNGLGYKISQHQDTDTDGDVDANDKWFHGVYDTNWRMVAIFRDDDTDPKEQFVHHSAGADGLGGSSYIDRIILRDRDNTNGPTGAPDGTLEERRYYCQNWRHDVAAAVTSGGVLVEWGKYSSYGVPFGLPGADTDSDGDCDSTDITQIQTWINASTYDVRADLDLDGDVDSTDKTNAQNNYQGTTLGWNVMSGVRRQHGYAGYEWDVAVSKYQVRFRVLDPHLGRWTRRDPLQYIDGPNLSIYVSASPMSLVDPIGGCWEPPNGGNEEEQNFSLWAWWAPIGGTTLRAQTTGWADRPDGTGFSGQQFNFAKLPRNQPSGNPQIDRPCYFTTSDCPSIHTTIIPQLVYTWQAEPWARGRSSHSIQIDWACDGDGRVSTPTLTFTDESHLSTGHRFVQYAWEFGETFFDQFHSEAITRYTVSARMAWVPSRIKNPLSRDSGNLVIPNLGVQGGAGISPYEWGMESEVFLRVGCDCVGGKR